MSHHLSNKYFVFDVSGGHEVVQTARIWTYDHIEPLVIHLNRVTDGLLESPAVGTDRSVGMQLMAASFLQNCGFKVSVSLVSI
jgi:hypothetical protein